MKKIVIWGTGKNAENFIGMLNLNNNKVIAFIDNNSKMWNKRAYNMADIISPEEIRNLEYDVLVICSMYKLEIEEQCISLGITNYFFSDEIDSIMLEHESIFLQSVIVANNYTKICETWKMTHELIWRNNFVDTFRGCSWYKPISLSVGRWAVAYNYMYVCCRILEDIKPKNILEMGMGQSSKLINLYVEHAKEHVNYDVVEQDQEWIDFFEKKDTMQVYHRNIITKEMLNDVVYVYEDFGSVVKGKKYSFISVDGPWGGSNLARIDILSYLPDILDDEFVVVVDDYERHGEQRMVEMLKRKLDENNIKYYCRNYESIKDVCVIASAGFKFLMTL